MSACPGEGEEGRSGSLQTHFYPAHCALAAASSPVAICLLYETRPVQHLTGAASLGMEVFVAIRVGNAVVLTLLSCSGNKTRGETRCYKWPTLNGFCVDVVRLRLCSWGTSGRLEILGFLL